MLIQIAQYYLLIPKNVESLNNFHRNLPGRQVEGESRAAGAEGTKNRSTGAALPLQAFHIEFCFTISAIHPER